nr:Dihydrofolate reductase [uncultured bacterium]
MIAAIGANNELGHGNDLIWRIPADMKRFREKTAGHPVIMGRKTYESIGRLLPNRTNIIISREVEPFLVSHPELAMALSESERVSGSQNEIPGPPFGGRNDIGSVVDSIEKAIDQAKSQSGSEEIFIIGGAQIYTLGLPLADKLYITKINSQNPIADAFFPDFSEFTKVVFKESHNDDGLEYEFLELER